MKEEYIYVVYLTYENVEKKYVHKTKDKAEWKLREIKAAIELLGFKNLEIRTFIESYPIQE